MTGSLVTSPRLWLAEPAIDAMIQAAQEAGPFETGGLLLGVRTSDGVWVTKVLELPARNPSPRSFVIERGATRPPIDAARAQDGRLGYLGDWHSHPANAGASGLDLRTLGELAVAAIHQHRVIAVARRRDSEWDIDAWVLGRFRVPVRCEWRVTGPLGPPLA